MCTKLPTFCLSWPEKHYQVEIRGLFHHVCSFFAFPYIPRYLFAKPRYHLLRRGNHRVAVQAEYPPIE
ncbi:MAG: hypothetical protein Q4E65_07400, partial [Clostridia bacterium]|nr:hypothetical protein [Clostridia bacterium]